MMLRELAANLRESIGLAQKKDIRLASERFDWSVRGPWGNVPVKLGDDCAAIPDGDGYLLFAIEGISPELVQASPRAAGYCSVLVNASDVFSMGGRPLAVVDALFSAGPEAAHPILEGIHRAASRLGIPVVGGHTNLSSPYAALAVAIVGRAASLITSFDARAGDDVVVGIDLRGKMISNNPFWDATDAPPARMQEDYEILPKLAEAGLVRAGKDISMAGLAGTLLMLIESSGVGANLALDRVPCPRGVDLSRWLTAFPSYGFVLAVAPVHSDEVVAAFSARGIGSAVVGSIDAGRKLTLSSRDEHEVVWDLAREGLTQSDAARSLHA
jgi:AIR synthase-related protein